MILQVGIALWRPARTSTAVWAKLRGGTRLSRGGRYGILATLNTKPLMLGEFRAEGLGFQGSGARNCGVLLQTEPACSFWAHAV